MYQEMKSLEYAVSIYVEKKFSSRVGNGEGDTITASLANGLLRNLALNNIVEKNSMIDFAAELGVFNYKFHPKFANRETEKNIFKEFPRETSLEFLADYKYIKERVDQLLLPFPKVSLQEEVPLHNLVYFEGT